MHNEIHKTAILLFARTAETEARHKMVCPGNNSTTNYRVLKTMHEHTMRVAQGSCMDVFHVSELSQHGATFGERLRSAFFQVFQEGYERVLAIGNDCVNLTGDDLDLAANKFTHEHLLLGPARDGGVYLLGISRKRFFSFDFDGVNWRTNLVLEQLQAMDPGAILLPTLSDIDSADDLCRVLLSAAVPARLVHNLRTLVPGNTAHYSIVREVALSRAEFPGQESRRGPPASA